MRLRSGKRINPQHFQKTYGEGYLVSFPAGGYDPRTYQIIREQCRRGDWTYYRGDSTGQEIRALRWDNNKMNNIGPKFMDYYIFSNPDDAMMSKLHF